MTKTKAASRGAAKTTTLPVPELIAKKRDGGALNEEEIQGLIRGYTDGSVTDYQMAAFNMAVFFRGMTPVETTAFTLAMRDSGVVVDLSAVPGVKVDKHSTGGVGDKVSICLAPMVAACGVPVPMISGRGLGHTGGTVDKLEAIPGFRMDMSTKAFAKQLGKVGCSLFKQTAELAPADRKLYALRDVTATVESVPLITGSILSKKLAEGIDALVLDVKVGKGAFMKTPEQARELARSIVRVGKLAGKKVSALLTRMDAPLGRAVGNANETAEAIEVLHGGGPEDLVECTLALAVEMLRLGGVARSERDARRMLAEAVASGAAAAKMREIIRAQGGDPRVVDEPDRLPAAKGRHVVRAERAGVVTGIDALEIGWSSVALGAGRTRADQDVDPAVGIVIDAPLGTKVAKGDALATLHVHPKQKVDGPAARVAAAFTLGRKAPEIGPLVLEVIR
ncbi:MAG: thymidine phosphorylase [Myxococcales bacterium]|nr:thymidine phosphorylase [Myxococcales bacterium]